MKDIETREDIIELVNAFYQQAKYDPDLSKVFLEMKALTETDILQAMYNFWENIILFTGPYKGKPLYRFIAGRELKPQHFKAWNTIFNQTVDNLYEGYHADQAKYRSREILDILKNRWLKTGG